MNPRSYSISSDWEGAKREALACLRAGGILLFPTETVYGLGVDSDQPAALERLCELKGRPREKSFQWLIADTAAARSRSAGWSEDAEKLARAFWPGPLTLVVPAEGGTLGWRVPDHPWLQEVLRELGRPLVATSANRSGQPPCVSPREALRAMAGGISVAVDGGEMAGGRASTVAALEAGGRLRVLRPGVISKEMLRQALRN